VTWGGRRVVAVGLVAAAALGVLGWRLGSATRPEAAPPAAATRATPVSSPTRLPVTPPGTSPPATARASEPVTRGATPPVTSPGPATPLSVRVSGNRLVDGTGRPVRLLGVNRTGTQYACVEGTGVFDGPSDAASVAAMTAWHITAVRVSLNEHCWLGINGVDARFGGAAYRAAITGYVDRLTAAGLYVVLDLHWNAPGTERAKDQQPMADRDHAPAFWASVAATFRDRPAVLFDLYNEPYPDDNQDTTAAWTCVRDGGTCPGVPFTAAGAQELLSAVRGAGARNVVLVGGPQYAGTLDRWAEFAPVDPAGQLAASVHIYYGTPAKPEWAPCDQPACWARDIAPLAATTPVVIGEVGEHDCDSALMMPLLRWADARGLSYLAWSWLPGDCAAEPALLRDWDGTPSGEGAGLRSHLLDLPR